MKEKMKPYILLLPVTIIIVSILGVGIINCLSQSLGYFPTVGLNEITLKYYKEVLTSREFVEALKFSLFTCTLSSLIAEFIGVVLAYIIFTHKKRSKILDIIYKIPIIIPHTVAVLLIINMLSQNGILARILFNLGLISSRNIFPNLIMDKWGIGIIITYVWKEIPFIILVIYAVLTNIDEKMWHLSKTLGASKTQTFFYVIFPMLVTSILSSFIIIFAFSFGAFEVPYLLGPTTPKSLSVKAYIEYSNPDLTNRPYAMVINTILIVISTFLIILYRKSLDIF
ncbi:spermidine/putrescine ABC transporter permease [Clostridium botulinum A2 117]|uniref:ABC transporter permease n=1 Tax=Clostridium botulinum TaxID=1491 RepID=UPI0007DF9698|nr:ABC transporter permease subunit [Clostridium botulinum]KEI78114.1 spermidine/putrescine ABC transporter permease [Clostridium botulinum A2 117]MBN3415300.1 spermidine/putrescine ABC transporter permease [Clostridium botulinum]MBN3441593.1 spermidine/putrescine ABC transporter permease [Clostridium botulinum]MBY6805653.1 ABC transporter permease subunit [Clostridium botulinum]MCS4475299.1 ABC transporter permease subunit [Clostridium botulinum]